MAMQLAIAPSEHGHSAHPSPCAMPCVAREHMALCWTGNNAGLDKMVATLEPVKQKFPGLSYADLYTLAGVTAIEAAGGPKGGATQMA